MSALFGPAGNSLSFTDMGYKNNLDIPTYLIKMGLDAYEYQCGRGVKINKNNAKEFGAEALKKGIKLSLHAPYYISLSSKEEEKRHNSIRYIEESAIAANNMGATRIIVHSGSCGGMDRHVALLLAQDTLKKAQEKLDSLELSNINICPETMGKMNQLGTIDETLELCKVDERFIPCIDFGHLNARTLGGIKGASDYNEILLKIENELGNDRLKCFHSHFSKIEYTENGGEKRHLTFEDRVFGPTFEPLGELIYKKGLSPIFICESAGTQAEDASFMKQSYLNHIIE